MTGLEEFLSGTIRLSAPLILAALGEIVSQRSGVINISIEGMMLGGAFAGFAAGAATGSAGAGLLAAAAAGALLGCVFAFLCVVRNADQIVAGMGINIAMIGLTGALMFGGRWLVQFIASRRAGRPVIPRLFWYMSIVGSFMTLSYFLFSAKQDSVGVLQNLFPGFTAAYSLYKDIQHRGWNRDKDTPA